MAKGQQEKKNKKREALERLAVGKRWPFTSVAYYKAFVIR